MRKIAALLSIVALSQLTGCVVHRYSTYDPYNRSYSNSYPTSYPAQYPNEQYVAPQPQQAQPSYASQYQDPYQGNYQQSTSEVAQIVSIRNIGQVQQNSGGGGAVLGAIIGGIVGNQLGRGDDHGGGRGRGYERGHRGDDGAGRAAATVGGAIVGGLIGNEVERGSTETQRVVTEITLRFANGQVQAVQTDNPGQFRVGDRVRVSFQGGRWIIN